MAQLVPVTGEAAKVWAIVSGLVWTDVPGNPVVLAHERRSAVLRIAKMPTCVGLGSTKTIAKLRGALAKGDPTMDDVCDLRDEGTRHRAMSGPLSTAYLRASRHTPPR